MKIFKRWSLRGQALNTEKDPNGRRGWRKPIEGWRGWLHGRAWLCRDFATNKSKEFRISWDLGDPWGLAAKIYLGPTIMADGDPSCVCVHLGLPFLKLYLSTEQVVPEWLLPGNHPVPGGRKYERTPGREVGFSTHDGKVWVSVWERGDGSWRRSDPWWSKVQALDPRNLLGPETRTSEDEPLGTVEIPMPEGVYQAKASIRRVTVRRWHFKSTWWRINFDEFEGPQGQSSIPFPGKGENSWDCGMDGCHGMSVPAGLELPEAIGYLVGSILRTRLKRTGKISWQPSEDATQDDDD